MRLLFAFLFLSFIGFSQAPYQFKYQSIARSTSGDAMVSVPVSLRISIRDLTSVGTIVYQETHATTTNEFGLFSLNIGGGTATVGSMTLVDWGNGAKFVEIEADLTGGTNYQPYGTSELLSVPYAIYATSSGTPILPNGTAVGNTTYWDGTEWVVSSGNLYHDGTRVGIGTTTPQQKLSVQGNINIPTDSSYRINNDRILSTRGTSNLFVGQYAGSSNTLGYTNSFLGYNSGFNNTVGTQNTFVGAESGTANLFGGMNSFVGRRAGFSNFEGNENTFIGAYAGQSNTSGQHNSFVGVTTGNDNVSGNENSFYGAHAGYFNSTGSFNTFVGNFAGENNIGGNYVTLLGFEADVTNGSYSNAMALGSGALVNASNTVVIGNTAVTSIGGQVGWSTLSDGRLKKNVQSNDLGLAFINRLNTVSYEYKAEGQAGIRYSGLIAQDVESILNELGVDFSGVVRPQSDNDFYSIRYSEFVVPLIKAVQEQQTEIEKLKSEKELLEERMRVLEEKMNKILEKE